MEPFRYQYSIIRACCCFKLIRGLMAEFKIYEPLDIEDYAGKYGNFIMEVQILENDEGLQKAFYRMICRYCNQST